MVAMNRKISKGASRRRMSTLTGAVMLAGALGLLLAGCANGDPAPGASERREVVAATALPPAARTAIDAMFADREAMGETRAVIVMRNGETIYEAYGDGFGPDSKLISWSMAKTITAVAVGLLVADGRLVLDDPAPIADWQRPGDQRGSISLRHLLTMSSGLHHVEQGDPVWEADTVRMLFGDGAPAMAQMAETQPLVAVPGEQFNYSSATSVILSDVIASALTDSRVPAVRRDAVRNFLTGRLIEPLSMSSLTPEFDASGTMIGGSIMHATARDYATFGEFLRRRGVAADGTRLVPERWIDFMLSPSRANPGYGGHIWLNRAGGGRDSPLWPQQGPADLFACLGHQGQFIVVSPRQGLTVVRLGISTREQIDAVRDQLRQLFGAL